MLDSAFALSNLLLLKGAIKEIKRSSPTKKSYTLMGRKLLTMGKSNDPQSVISVMTIWGLFLSRFFRTLRAQWGSIVTEPLARRSQK